jgi:hypothetical protein
MIQMPPDGPFLFVSYSSKDASFVHPEIERLERQGYKIWFDQGELQPTRFWADEIRKAIEACGCFVVFITEDAVVSANVCEEISQALNEHKPILGVYWDDVELPPHLQSQIRRRQTLDRHSLHPSAYEELLSTALSEYIGVTESISNTHNDIPQEVPRPSSPRTPSDILPITVVFGLLMFVVLLTVLSIVSFVMPYVPSLRGSDDLFNNRLVGLLAGLFFLGLAFAFGAGAFVVFRIYLWGRK